MPHPTHDPLDGESHRCIECREVKPARCYPPSAFRRRAFLCRECNRMKMRANYDANRERADALKLERGCADCGYRAAATALEFDHLPGFKKRGSVSSLYPGHASSVATEIAKCEVVCANCHAIRTQERGAGLAYWEQWRTEQEGEVVPLGEDGQLPLLLPPVNRHKGRPFPHP